jgi:histidyl-tRNA synthetase
MGIERLLALWQDQGHRHEVPAPDAYLVHQGEAAGRFAFRIAEALRSGGFSVHLHCGGGSFKSQMKKADGSGAQLALIVGDDETAANEVSVKPLRSDADHPAAQVRVSFDDLADHIGDILFPMEDDNGSL